MKLSKLSDLFAKYWSAEQTATFTKGGVHPKEFKNLARHLAIEPMPSPNRIRLFLKQHVGVPCTLLTDAKPVYTPEYFLGDNAQGSLLELKTKKRQKVSEGQLIASVGQKLGAELHASMDGHIEGVFDTIHPLMGKAPAVSIVKDPEHQRPSYTVRNWLTLSPQELMDKIHAAGVVGLGGAGFPADAKLKVKPGTKLDTLLLNGAECEPYITCDHRVMLEYPEDIIEGAKILLTILGIKKCIIGIESNKPDTIAVLNNAIAKNRKHLTALGFMIKVTPLEVKYPQGSADQIMESAAGRIRPSGQRSSSIGIIVQNVYSTKVIYDAVVLDKPFYERVVTVSGKAIKRRANLLVRIGTSLGDIVEYLGGVTPDLAKIIIGGPMMGFAVSSLDMPVTKTTNGILFLRKDEVDDRPYGPCIRCGFCLDACPMGLEPNEISLFVEAGRGAECVQFGMMDDCFECGSCAFVCPSRRPLVQFVRLAREKIWEAEREEQE